MQTNGENISAEGARFSIRPLTNLQMAAVYGVGIKTFNKWLAPFRAEIGKKAGRYYTNIQVKTIIQKLGMPNEIITG